MTFWDFANNDHAFAAVAIVLIVAVGITSIASWPFRLVNRWIRHQNIKARGWPPEYLDADGDLRPLPDED